MAGKGTSLVIDSTISMGANVLFCKLTKRFGVTILPPLLGVVYSISF